MKLQDQREVDIYIKKLQEMLPELNILVEFNGSITLLGCAGLENELSDRLGIKVDPVSKTALKPRIGKHVLSEVVEV
ncbi:nucleotidyltransferase [Methanosarcina siciliae C2J]|uniref:Nucleotidyltransferase n=1 Tax=Methanosarcina siciliae C2J TaxID=1434118 RepID=A0A0E3PQW8_9EURY|nr:hypothetical protein [Methanosarcina siciliae]AKB37009.1 nucleotidyltransferase [Methanosarcina siciliae C2J]